MNLSVVGPVTSRGFWARLTAVSLILSSGLSCTRGAPKTATQSGTQPETHAESRIQAAQLTAPAQATTLSVGLYPYVPRVEQFQQAISAAWSGVHADVTLSFNSEWDGGYSADPSDIDVFVFDAMYLDYFRTQGLLSTLTPAEVPETEDYLPYAIEGVSFQGNYLGIPMLGCTNMLFYRQGDSAIAQARTLTEIEEVLGQCSYTSQVPPDARGLMLDMAGGTTNAALYIDVTHNLNGAWPPELPPTTAQLNTTSIARMRSLLATASYYNATEDVDAYGRASWFSQSHGRVTMGFTESMSAMSAVTRSTVQFKIFPLGDDPKVRPLFYSDVIGISASTTHRELAVELANLMASTHVLVNSMQGAQGQSPQYLMPVRRSVFGRLSQSDPIYARMQSVVTTANPILFNLGSNARQWISHMKGAIKQQSRSNYACGCDQNAGAISSQAQASQVCPGVCAQYGGWNGQWTAYPPGGTQDWQGGCGCKTCSIQ